MNGIVEENKILRRLILIMKRTYLKFLTAIVFCFTIFSVAAFAAEPSDITIGVSLLTREHVFYNLVEEAMQAKASELGIKIIVMDGQQDSSVQYSQIQDFVTQEVDGIILAAASSAGSKGAIEIAQKKDIPVVTIGTKTDGNPSSHFQTNEWVGGELAGKYAAKVLDGKGDVAIITYDEIEQCVDRAEGFKSIFKDYPGIKVVDEQNYQGNAEKAATIAKDFLTKHPDLKLVFAVGDPAAIGAYTTFNAAKKDIKIIGYDGNPEGVNEIKKKGIWIADVAQSPALMGGGAVQAVVDAINGKTVEKEVLIAPYMIDAENAK
jgi:ribose transport system substrate-binding protein